MLGECSKGWRSQYASELKAQYRELAARSRQPFASSATAGDVLRYILTLADVPE